MICEVLIENTIKPLTRAVKYEWLQWSAKQQANWITVCNPNSNKPTAFIVGCGRSGTTILGQTLSYHPQVHYLFEPYHLWAAIDPRTDVLNLFHHGDASLFMDCSYYNEQSQVRFNRLIRSFQGSDQAKLTIEKTPLNALRIGYLEALAPGSKFVHIVRDGVDVCQSINRLASTNSYKIAGKPTLNQWWGVDFAKWKILISDGTTAGYYTDEVYRLDNHSSMAAYEWLVTLSEIERWRAILGDRLKELTYNTFTSQPRTTLDELCVFFEIDLPFSWIDKAVSAISSFQRNDKFTLSLPPAMCKAFNNYQEQYGFPNRAVCIEEA